MARLAISFAILPAFAAAAFPQEKDTIRVRNDNKVSERECIITDLTCEKVDFKIEVETEEGKPPKFMRQSEPADNVEEFSLAKGRKPVEFLQAEDEMDGGNYGAAVKSWAKAIADDDVKGDPVYKQVAMYKRALCFYYMNQFDQAIEAYRSLKSALPETYFLRKVYSDLYDCHRLKGDSAGANKAIGEFEAEGGKRGKTAWGKLAKLLRADLHEHDRNYAEAQKIYMMYTGEKGEVGEEAQIGELRCLSALKNHDQLKAKSESIIRDGRRRSFRALCAAYNGLGEVLRSKEKKPKEALLAYLRGICEFQKYIFGTREHENSLAMSAVTMAEYGRTLPEEDKKDLYQARAVGLFRELMSRYPNSPLVKLAREVIEKR
jgi:tetratricopeptide (TPR) repeat protein